MRYRIWLAAAVGIGMWMGAQAYGQAGGKAPATPTPTPANRPGEANSNAGNLANYDNMAEHQRGGLQFTGEVKVKDAPLPWDPIPVVVTCNGVVKYRTQADPKGRFMIQGSHTASGSVETKASVNQAAASQLVGCDVSADVPGFKSSTIRIANRDIRDNPDIGTITLRPDSGAAGSSESPTTAAAPKEAMKHIDKARADWLNRNANGAERELEKAVKIDPQFAEAWYQLGKLQQMKKENDKALVSYQKAVAADPKFVLPYEEIAELSAPQKKWQDMENAADTALKLDPAGTPQLWYFDALAKYNLGKVNEAEASARKSMAMDPQHLAPNTEQLLAVMLASQGQLEEALKHLQNSLTYVKPGPDADLIKQQIAQLEKALPPSETPSSAAK
ncbi:MAG: tetratricopeptide repeat protein [Acidobacteriaceae bacterium]